MASIAFDTHAFVKELTEAGMPEVQAEVLARSQAKLINEQLATKQDLVELEERLRRDMKELELRHDLTIRLGSMMVIAVGVGRRPCEAALTGGSAARNSLPRTNPAASVVAGLSS